MSKILRHSNHRRSPASSKSPPADTESCTRCWPERECASERPWRFGSKTTTRTTRRLVQTAKSSTFARASGEDKSRRRRQAMRFGILMCIPILRPCCKSSLTPGVLAGYFKRVRERHYHCSMIGAILSTLGYRGYYTFLQFRTTLLLV